MIEVLLLETVASVMFFTRNDPISGILQFTLLDQEELVSVVKR